MAFPIALAILSQSFLWTAFDRDQGQARSTTGQRLMRDMLEIYAALLPFGSTR